MEKQPIAAKIIPFADKSDKAKSETEDITSNEEHYPKSVEQYKKLKALAQSTEDPSDAIEQSDAEVAQLVDSSEQAEEAEQLSGPAKVQDEVAAKQMLGANGQQELPFAVVQGKPLTELPQDLYIPPDALEVFLEAFEGPLDLLLYLIKRQNLDILDINVSQITTQYISYVEMMNSMRFELAAEYLLMAAMLAEIKSRMLLPRSEEIEDDEEDPRAQLIRRLQEYERYKLAAEEIDNIPRMNREIYMASAESPEIDTTRPEPDVEMRELLLVLSQVLKRAEMFESHHIEREMLSTRQRMSDVLDVLSPERFTPFISLFQSGEGRLGVVVTFLAIMELIKESLVELIQTEPLGPIHVKARSAQALDDTSDTDFDNSHHQH